MSKIVSTKDIFCPDHKRQVEKVNNLEITMSEIKNELQHINKNIDTMREDMKDFMYKVEQKYALQSNVDKIKMDVDCLRYDMRTIQIKWATISGGMIVVYFIINVLLKMYGFL
jgi:predicted  nucleic acid-binding Zn-ribbon protein